MENYKEYLYDKDWLKSKNLFIEIFQFKSSLKYHYRGGIIDDKGKERFRFYSPILGFTNKDEMLDEANRMINKMLKNPIEERWEVVPMEEVWDLAYKYIPEEHKKNIKKPKFPTKRWGDVTTKTSTTDKKSIEILLEKLKFEYKRYRKRIDHETSEKLKNTAGGKKFYKLEVLKYY